MKQNVKVFFHLRCLAVASGGARGRSTITQDRAPSRLSAHSDRQRSAGIHCRKLLIYRAVYMSPSMENSPQLNFLSTVKTQNNLPDLECNPRRNLMLWGT